MMTRQGQRFNTKRLLVDEWRSFTPQEWPQQDQAKAVQEILTPGVTASLPPSWQGHFSLDRARQWAAERDKEGTTLLAVDKSDQRAIGMVVIYEAEATGHLRLGYMLRETAWGKGFASELIGGFVDWCRSNGVRSITGGVEHGNIASMRVLEKCGFVAEVVTDKNSERMFVLKLR